MDAKDALDASLGVYSLTKRLPSCWPQHLEERVQRVHASFNLAQMKKR